MEGVGGGRHCQGVRVVNDPMQGGLRVLKLVVRLHLRGSSCTCVVETQPSWSWGIHQELYNPGDEDL